MKVGHRLHQRKPDTGTGCGITGLIETVKDKRKFVGRNALSVVFYRKNSVGIFPPDRDRNDSVS